MCVCACVRACVRACVCEYVSVCLCVACCVRMRVFCFPLPPSPLFFLRSIPPVLSSPSSSHHHHHHHTHTHLSSSSLPPSLSVLQAPLGLPSGGTRREEKLLGSVPSNARGAVIVFEKTAAQVALEAASGEQTVFVCKTQRQTAFSPCNCPLAVARHSDCFFSTSLPPLGREGVSFRLVPVLPDGTLLWQQAYPSASFSWLIGRPVWCASVCVCTCVCVCVWAILSPSRFLSFPPSLFLPLFLSLPLSPLPPANSLHALLLFVDTASRYAAAHNIHWAVLFRQRGWG